MLEILVTLWATVIHPAIHYWHNSFYQTRDKVPEIYDNMFWHGQSLNHSAHYYPGFMLGCGPDHFRMALDYQGGSHQPPRKHGLDKDLIESSKFLSFLSQGRFVLFKLLEKYQIPVEKEKYFILSQVHSVDHYLFWKAVENVKMTSIKDIK
jgi:hypothetical protein